MTILEMKDKRALLLEANQDTLKSAKAEMRKLSADEGKSFSETIEAVKKLDGEIRTAEDKLQKETRNINSKSNKKYEK